MATESFILQVPWTLRLNGSAALRPCSNSLAATSPEGAAPRQLYRARGHHDRLKEGNRAGGRRSARHPATEAHRVRTRQATQKSAGQATGMTRNTHRASRVVRDSADRRVQNSCTRLPAAAITQSLQQRRLINLAIAAADNLRQKAIYASITDEGAKQDKHDTHDRIMQQRSKPRGLPKPSNDANATRPSQWTNAARHAKQNERERASREGGAAERARRGCEARTQS